MAKLSFIEKLGVLVSTSIDSKLLILFLIVLVFLGIALAKTNKKNEKINKAIYCITTILILTFIIITYHDSIGKMITYMMNNFFVAAFFPNLAIYMAALIATNIILWISIFSFKSSKQIKILNIVIYIIMNYLLALILNTVKTDNLDIFSQTAVYENKTASALISLSSTIFIAWIIFLIVYKILLIYLRKDYKPKVKKILVKRKVKKLPENYLPLDTPDYIYGVAPKRRSIELNKTQTKGISKDMESMFTLEDYKLLQKMLNERKQEEKQIKVKEIIDVDDIDFDEIKERPVAEKKEIEKEEIIEDEQKELQKYNELLELYRIN